MPVDVLAQGPDNKERAIRYVLVNKVTAFDLVVSGLVARARELGFSRVEISDGRDETFFWKLD